MELKAKMMDTTTIIKNERQYRKYLSEVDSLMSSDPHVNTNKGKRLELLFLLIENYESERFKISVPNPIDAIIFRMEEEGLRQKDLVPIIGNKSKVSEVLSGKRPLTLKMVRALSSQLNIPAEVLISEVEEDIEDLSFENNIIDWSKYPFKDMNKRGWLSSYIDKNDNLTDAIKEFFAEAGGMKEGASYFRRSLHIGGEVANNIYSLNAWLARVILKSRDIHVLNNHYKSVDPEEFMKELAKLSWFDQGPRLARDFLEKEGIKLVIEPRLPGTKLDGAATNDIDGTPVIGMTLRFDRLDNFWFTLLHEVSHVFYHIGDHQEAFLDNTQRDPDDEKYEVEANLYAQEAFIPRQVWHRSDAFKYQSADSVIKLSSELRISPAVIAGRIRKETNNYKKLNRLVGHGKVHDALFN